MFYNHSSILAFTWFNSNYLFCFTFSCFYFTLFTLLNSITFFFSVFLHFSCLLSFTFFLPFTFFITRSLSFILYHSFFITCSLSLSRFLFPIKIIKVVFINWNPIFSFTELWSKDNWTLILGNIVEIIRQWSVNHSEKKQKAKTYYHQDTITQTFWKFQNRYTFYHQTKKT